MEEILQANKKLNLIWAHPRKDSLTSNIALAIKEQVTEIGYEVNATDLYAINFNPVLDLIDEPDWNNPLKEYSDVVQNLSADLSPENIIVMVFPIWWYQLPAMLKGYIDRVWNYGITYGEGSKVPAKKIIWIALVGEDREGFSKRKHNQHLENLFNKGIASYCRIPESEVLFLYNTIGKDLDDPNTYYQNLIAEAINFVKMKI